MAEFLLPKAMQLATAWSMWSLRPMSVARRNRYYSVPGTYAYHRRIAELAFEIVQEADGGYCSECLTESIFTEGDTWDELRRNVREATSAFFFDRPGPDWIRLHPVRDEILSEA
jgi:hypothetical protein